MNAELKKLLKFADAKTYIDASGQLIWKCYIDCTLLCDSESETRYLPSVSSDFTCEYKPSGKRPYFQDVDDMPTSKQSKLDVEDLDL